MIVVKGIILFSIFAVCTIIGLVFSKSYRDRVEDLKEVRQILNLLKTKIEYTYEPLPKIFSDLGTEFDDEVGRIFKIAAEKMNNQDAGTAWKSATKSSKTNMKDEDIKVLENFEKLLGKTDINGQLSQIELIREFIDCQIEKAEEEQRKNEKLYKSLGAIVGLTIAIIFI